jgi:NADH-quinone oxidoreductase subunit E
MSIFPIPVELLPDTKKLDEMNKEFAVLMPKEFADAVNLMVHPAAGVAAFSALGLGIASHALGLWIGAAAGAAEVSQRLFMPFLDETTPDDFRDRSKTPVKRARAVADSVIADARTAAVDARKRPPDAAAVTDEVEPAAQTKPATEVKPAATQPAEAAAPESVETVAKTAAELAIGESAGELMPEDFRQPKAMNKPKAPDDLKLISGIGPKLETVLNGLGIWTFAQIAAWTREEIAWVDDYLAFKGRIGRDSWIEQAAALKKSKTRH